jgi:Ca2+-binding EF-hand superfamily protein
MTGKKANTTGKDESLELWKVRTITTKTRQSLQCNQNAITPELKLKMVLDAVKNSVADVFDEANAAQVFKQTASEGSLHNKVQQSLEALAKEKKLIGEGAGATWVNGVNVLSELVYALLDLQAKESGSPEMADHRDQVRDTMTQVARQVRLAEGHIMQTYGLRVDKYRDRFTTAEKILSNLSTQIEVLRGHLVVLQNSSLAKALVDFFVDVPKVQLFEAFENLNAALMKELEKADKYMKGIIQLFASADLDKNGLISKQELSLMLSKFGAWTPDQCEKLFMKADVNNDRELHYDEFVRWIFGEDRVLADAAEHYQMALAIFRQYDKDCSGFINAKELQEYYAEHEGEKIKMAKAKQLIRELDTNGDKKVDCFEFIQYLNGKDVGG